MAPVQITNSKSTAFPLSKIHRLLRPLRSSISSLHQALQTLRQRCSYQSLRQAANHRIFREQKSQKRKREEDSDFNPYKKPQKQATNTRPRPATQLSSPLFEKSDATHHSHLRPPRKPFYGQRKIIRQFPRSKLPRLGLGQDDNEEEISQKIDKVLSAYKNILESLYTVNDQSSNTTSERPSRLTISCARVIGRSIEHVIRSQARLNHQEYDHADEERSLAEEDVWQTSEMDEWYDAIPMLYRRYALAQHALSLILIEFPLIQEKQSPSKRGTNALNSHTRTLLNGIHRLHRSHASCTLITAQAASLLPALFMLPTPDWSELYDAAYHQFGLVAEFDDLFQRHLAPRSFISHWCDWNSGLVGFIDGAIHHFGARAIELWVHEREQHFSQQHARREAQDAGLESQSDADDVNGRRANDYDTRTGPVIVQWLDSLLQSCLPGSVHCLVARSRLNEISRIVFDALEQHAGYPDLDQHAFISMVALAIESHRFALFNLPIFEPHPTSPGGVSTPAASKHDPIRLLNVIRLIKAHSNQHRVLGKAAKVFLRAHRATRLLAVVGRQEWLIPGLDALLESVRTSEWAESLTELARSWVLSLLRTDPASWWTGGDEGDRREVRGWLEEWLARLADIDHRAAVSEEGDEGHGGGGELSMTLGSQGGREKWEVETGESGLFFLAGLEDESGGATEDGVDWVEDHEFASDHQPVEVDNKDEEEEEPYGPSKRRRASRIEKHLNPNLEARSCTCGGRGYIHSGVVVITGPGGDGNDDEKPKVESGMRQRRPTPPPARGSGRRSMWLSSGVERFPSVQRVSQTPTPTITSSRAGQDQQPNRRVASASSSDFFSARASTSTSGASVKDGVPNSSVLRPSTSMNDLLSLRSKGKGKGKELMDEKEDVDFDEFDLLSRPRSVTPWSMRKKKSGQVFEGVKTKKNGE